MSPTLLDAAVSRILTELEGAGGAIERPRLSEMVSASRTTMERAIKTLRSQGRIDSYRVGARTNPYIVVLTNKSRAR